MLIGCALIDPSRISVKGALLGPFLCEEIGEEQFIACPY